MSLSIFALVGWVGIPPLLLTVAAHLSIYRIGMPLPPVILSAPMALAFLGTADQLLGPVRRSDKGLATVHASTAPHAAQDLGRPRLCRPDLSRTAVCPASLHRTLYSPELGIVVLFRSRNSRHAFGSHSAMAGVDLATLKELMGHSKLSTPMRYVHPTPEHKREAVRKLVLRN